MKFSSSTLYILLALASGLVSAMPSPQTEEADGLDFEVNDPPLPYDAS